MLINTIRSTSNTLGLNDIQYKIYIDASMKRLYPELYNEYVVKIQNNINQHLSDLNVQIVDFKKTGETLRGNWECAIKDINTPYMMFLEHDWEFIYDVKVNEIIKTLETHNEVSYIKFPKHPLDPSNPPWAGTMEVYFKEENNLNNSSIPLSKISFLSGNPHIARVSYARDFYIPLLEENLPKNHKLSAGKSGVERDIKKLIDQSIKEYGIEQTHSMFKTYIYGVPPHPQVVKHSGEWCRKK